MTDIDSHVLLIIIYYPHLFTISQKVLSSYAYKPRPKMIFYVLGYFIQVTTLVHIPKSTGTITSSFRCRVFWTKFFLPVAFHLGQRARPATAAAGQFQPPPPPPSPAGRTALTILAASAAPRTLLPSRRCSVSAPSPARPRHVPRRRPLLCRRRPLPASPPPTRSLTMT